MIQMPTSAYQFRFNVVRSLYPLRSEDPPSRGKFEFHLRCLLEVTLFIYHINRLDSSLQVIDDPTSQR